MKTKSLSLLILLALCITISGVYAAWIYAETPLTKVHGHIGTLGLSSPQINNSKGTITVDASNAHLVIDQADTDYNAVLTATGTIKVVFSPSDIFADSNADLTQMNMKYGLVTDNATPTAFMVNDGTGEKPLFTEFKTDVLGDITLTRVDDALDANYGKYVAYIDATVLLSLITLNSFKLPSYADYTAFSAQVGIFGNIGIEISEPGATGLRN